MPKSKSNFQYFQDNSKNKDESLKQAALSTIKNSKNNLKTRKSFVPNMDVDEEGTREALRAAVGQYKKKSTIDDETKRAAIVTADFLSDDEDSRNHQKKKTVQHKNKKKEFQRNRPLRTNELIKSLSPRP